MSIIKVSGRKQQPSEPVPGLCMAQEMPGDVDYINLGRMIVPLELNYCQCMLELEEYYEVIEHTTELLEKHKGRRKSSAMILLLQSSSSFPKRNETGRLSWLLLCHLQLHSHTQLHRCFIPLRLAAARLILCTEVV